MSKKPAKPVKAKSVPTPPARPYPKAKTMMAAKKGSKSC